MNRIALVTGATAGIGEAVAVMLAKEGYHLIITGRRESRLQELAKRIVAESGVKTADDIDVLRKIGADAVLIGETLMKASDKKAKLAELKGYI